MSNKDDSGRPYDDSSIKSIAEYSSRLVGHTLREMTDAPELLDPKVMRGSFGNAVEKYYFMYTPNSDSAPDFPKVGLELKTTPLKRGPHGMLVAKERLVITMIDYMTDARIENAIDEVTRYLSAGAYAQGASQMISIVRQYVRAGIPEGQYRYDVVTGQRLTARHKALTKNEIILALVIGFAVCLIYVACVRSRYSLKGSTYHYSYQDNGAMKLTDQEDTYLRTTTTRVRKPDPPENTGSHGGGGGSGVHTSSSGTSHGGGGGHF